MPRSRAPASAQSGPAQTQAAQTQPAQVKAAQSAPRPAAAAGQTEQKAAPSLAFSINPATLLFGSFGAEVEGAVDPAVSLFAAPSFTFGTGVFTPTTNVSIAGFGVDVGVRYFSGNHAPKGFWLGPYAGFAIVNATAGTVEVNATGLGVGGMLGYNWISDGGFYFSLGAGAGYRAILLDANTNVGSSAAAAGGAALNFRLALGFAQ